MTRRSKLAVPMAALLPAALLLGAAAARQQPGASRSFERGVFLEDSAATSASISVGDVNGDGHLDIVLVKGRHWPLHDFVLLGSGKGSFQRAYALGGPPDRSYSGALVDLDGDGDLDIVVSNDTPDPKLVHLNDGRGRFAAGGTFGRSEWPTRYLSVADLDGDAVPDVVLANRYGNRPGPSHVCYGQRGGRFADCVAFAQGSATTIKAADMNGDGAPDLVVPHRDAGQSFVYLNDGRGRFPERRSFGPPNASIRSAEPADLNRDGVPDLVVIDEESGPAILWGRRDGTWSSVEPLGTRGTTPYALAVADLDRNGRPDVIVGFVKSRPIVYFNDGPDTFHAVPFGDDEGTAYGFSVGDLDEDGFLDIAMARSDARNMLYFGAPRAQGSPNGTQIGRASTPADSLPRSIAEAQEQGARHPRLDWKSVASQIGGRHVPGSTERRCVDVGSEREVRSGDFVAGNFAAYSGIWARGSGKLYWIPHRLAWPDSSTPLRVAAVPLDPGSGPRVFEKRTSARTVGVIPEVHFFPSGFRLPGKGTWMLVATAGPHWGCFIFTLR